MFTSLLNFIKTVKPRKLGLNASNIRPSPAPDDEQKERSDLDIEREALEKISLSDTPPEDVFLAPKDAVEFTLEALRAAITGENEKAHQEAVRPPTQTQNERVAAAYQKSDHLLDTVDHPTLHQPSPQKNGEEQGEHTKMALQQIEYLADHGVNFIYVKQGQDYFNALEEALRHFRKKQFSAIKQQQQNDENLKL